MSWATAASAEPAEQAGQYPNGSDVHVGLNFRTDFATRYYRLEGGVHVDHLDFIAVVDPLGLIKSDYDFDAIVAYELGNRWSVFGGGRLSMNPIERDFRFSEKALVGVSALLPNVVSDRVRIHSGLELAVHVHSHGGGVPSTWVCVDNVDCREDHFVFGLYGRVEYASPI